MRRIRERARRWGTLDDLIARMVTPVFPRHHITSGTWFIREYRRRFRKD